MADENVGLVVKVKVHGEQQLRKLKREIKSLNDHVTVFQNRVNNALNNVDNRWKKHFDQFDSMVKMMGGALTKFVTASAKFAAIQIGALGAAMMAVHGAFVLGNAAMKAFRYIAKGVAAGLAAVTVAASTAAAAIRENQAAMFAYKKLGKNEFGSGMNQVRQEMRAMARDTDLAGLSAKDLQSIYSEISKKGVYTQSSQALVKSLMDFGAAGQDVAKGAQAVGALVGMLQDPNATFSQITASAKELGPAMEDALKQAQTKGIDTVAELKSAILDGTLAVMGGVNGQFAAVNDTLIGRFKKAMGIIKADFADFGQMFLGPAKDALAQVEHIIRRTFVQVSGTLAKFGRGSMMDGIVNAVDKLARGFGDMINEYVPKAEGMLSRLSDWWQRFKNGWNDVLDRTRPFIDAARVLENMIGNILQPLFSEFGNAMDNTRELILNNREAFEEFGTRVGAFISAFGQFAGAVREVFVQALPYINMIVDGATKLFQLFTGILGKAKGFTDNFGAGGSFALAAGLLGAGRGMKNTIGGVVRDYTKEMNVQAGNVIVNGPGAYGATGTPGGYGATGMRSQGGVPSGQPVGRGGLPLVVAGGMQSQQGGGPTPMGTTKHGIQVSRGANGQMILTTAGGKVLSKKDAAYWRAMSSPLASGYTTSVQGVDPSRMQKLKGMNPFGRAGRTSGFYAQMFGDKEKGIKGFNQSGSAMIGTTLGLGMLTAIAPESSKGALALGSGVAAFNPMAGLAIAGLGSAATGTSAGFGMLTGAMGGAAAGSMVGGAPGAIAGAIIGAIAGGIMGAINKRKEDIKLARQAGQSMALRMQTGIMEGISSAVATSAGMQAGAARTNVEANMRSLIDQNAAAYNDLAQYSTYTDDQLRAAFDTQRITGQGPFANMSYEELEGASRNPMEYLQSSMNEFQIQRNAAQTTFDVYSSRMGQFTDMFGMDANQVFELARQSGLNLMDATVDFNTAVNQLTSALINNTVELNTFIADSYAGMYDMLSEAQKTADAPRIYDEAARTLYDKKLAGSLQRTDVLDFIGTALQQFPAMYADAPGGQIRGLYEFVRSFREGGTAFGFGPNGERLPLTGMQGDFYSPENAPLMNQLITKSTADIARANSELLVSGLASAGLQLSDPVAATRFGAALTEFGLRGELEAAIAADQANRLAGFGDQFALATTDEDRAKVQTEFQNFLLELEGILKFGPLGTTQVKELESSAAVMGNAVYDAIIDAFKPGFTLSAGTVDVKDTQSAIVNSSGTVNVNNFGDGGDTKLQKSKSIGDTTTNLARTLDAHNRLNNGAGNRFITSSYRNFNLGSSNSDHINGRAYDLVGDNLISYRDAVKRDGGFAEFHGDRSSRHLHVVPRIGDSISPAYSMTAGALATPGAQSSAPNVYNVNVYGAGSNAEEVANLVMHKIKVSEKMNRERAY
jgi:hypothetical protein